MPKITDVIVVTDGACSGNPGPGGWASILQCEGGHEMVVSGNEVNTTNNRMELIAVINGLKELRYPCNVVILTDSAYVANMANGGWIRRWGEKGWSTASNKPVKNRDLWETLAALMKVHTVKFEKVHGHSGHMLNERADAIAKQQAEIAKNLGTFTPKGVL